jgi:hypothetical protein
VTLAGPRICSTITDLQSILRTAHGCKYNMPIEFLFFLEVLNVNLLARAPAERLNRKIIEEYVKSQPSCGGITIANYLNHLQLTLRYICPTGPERDFLCDWNRIDGPAIF